ncbi:MAG: glutamate synthase subunit beta [Candidatus Omnitrophota bacterium]
MGDPKGFLKVKRTTVEYRPICERIKDYRNVAALRAEDKSREQASRCMDCGTPFCHSACPIGNYIPEWNDLVFHGHWQAALDLLSVSNNLPEITGRVCPALCEYACVLGINDDAVTIRENELAIVEYGFKHKLIYPIKPKKKTGKTVAVIGSGPSGLSCADQLNRAGHKVVVFERDRKIGGILRYGIPDFKLEKSLLDRRIDIWKKEGIEFRPGINVGVDYPSEKLLKEFDAACLCGGSRVPRDLKIEGRHFSGVYFAMDYLSVSNRRVSGEEILPGQVIDAQGKQVVVIGGGDTGSDCVGTAHRQQAARVVQIEVLLEPPACRPENMPWPVYPLILKTSSSHGEGGQRYWAVLTKKFTGQNNKVNSLECVRVNFEKDEKGCQQIKEIPGSEFIIPADLVIIAAGFLHPEHSGLLEKLKLEFDQRGNVKTGADYMSSIQKVFSAGDMRSGQSLVVWAISEGRNAAKAIDKYLT